MDYPCDIIVVDNDSQDGSVSFLQHRFPNIHLIVNSTNLGFAGACNQAIQIVLQAKYPPDYFLFINNDAWVDQQFLTKLIETAQTHPQAGILGPKVYDASSPTYIRFAGVDKHPLTLAPAEFSRTVPENGQWQEIREVDYIYGCGILVKRAVFDQIGLFDPCFFLYWEDCDLCLRAQLAGYKILFVPEAKMWHHGSGSTSAISDLKKYHLTKGLIYFLRKHLYGWQVPVAFLFWPIVFARILAYELLKTEEKNITGYLRGFWDSLSEKTGLGPQCILCGTTKTNYLFSDQDFLGTVSNTFENYKCLNCGLVFLYPRPSLAEISRLYLPDYVPFRPAVEDETNLVEKWLNYRRWQVRRRLITHYKESGSILDVGCATGVFLHELRKTGGWQTFGIDISETALKYARQRLQLDVFVGELREAQFADNQFDVVTFWDVIEHVPEPLKTLKEVARILKDDGILVINTPNSESLAAKLWGKQWAGWDIPRHLQLFSRSNIELLLSQANFQDFDWPSFPAEQDLFILSAERKFLSRVKSRLAKHIGIRLIFVISIFFWPLLRLLDRWRFSSNMVVVARLRNRRHDSG